MSEKKIHNAIDWLVDDVDFRFNFRKSMTKDELKVVLNGMCPLDDQLDSPCPRWVLNILRCCMLTSQNKHRLIFKHHEDISGQRVAAKIMYKFNGRKIEKR